VQLDKQGSTDYTAILMEDRSLPATSRTLALGSTMAGHVLHAAALSNDFVLGYQHNREVQYRSHWRAANLLRTPPAERVQEAIRSWGSINALVAIPSDVNPPITSCKFEIQPTVRRNGYPWDMQASSAPRKTVTRFIVVVTP
jgi:hypothetical protein